MFDVARAEPRASSELITSAALQSMNSRCTSSQSLWRIRNQLGMSCRAQRSRFRCSRLRSAAVIGLDPFGFRPRVVVISASILPIVDRPVRVPLAYKEIHSLPTTQRTFEPAFLIAQTLENFHAWRSSPRA
jgi:hypothetical protein